LFPETSMLRFSRHCAILRRSCTVSFGISLGLNSFEALCSCCSDSVLFLLRLCALSFKTLRSVRCFTTTVYSALGDIVFGLQSSAQMSFET
jgi:hypothetical protein